MAGCDLCLCLCAWHACMERVGCCEHAGPACVFCMWAVSHGAAETCTQSVPLLAATAGAELSHTALATSKQPNRRTLCAWAFFRTSSNALNESSLRTSSFSHTPFGEGGGGIDGEVGWGGRCAGTINSLALACMRQLCPALCSPKLLLPPAHMICSCCRCGAVQLGRAAAALAH